MTERIAALDVLRGVAVMGILAANIVAFALPESAYFSPAAYGPMRCVDLAAWGLTFVLVEGKMRGLFTLLFGASMLLVVERAEAAGDDPAFVHYSRMAWLFLFGMVHLYLFSWGDILTHYALVGAIAYPFRRLMTRTLVIVGLLLIAVQLAIFAGIGADFFAHPVAALVSAYGRPMPAEIAAELAAAHGGFLAMLRRRIATNVDPFSFAMVGGAETLGYMLLGMAGLRSGFLTGAWRWRRYAMVAAVALGVSLPVSTAIAVFDVSHGFDPRYVFASSMVLSTPIRPLMVAGYAALVILLMRTNGRLTQRIAAAGRMAFSNYLGTTLICTGVFYGWGLDLFGRVARADLYLIVVALWIAILAWSKPWLARFRYGPLEWLWRSLARLEWQPIRR